MIELDGSWCWGQKDHPNGLDRSTVQILALSFQITGHHAPTRASFHPKTRQEVRPTIPSQFSSLKRTSSIFEFYWFRVVRKNIYNTSAPKKRVWGQLCTSGAGFVPFPCHKRGLYPCMGTEMRLQIQISPIFGSKIRWITPYPLQQKKGCEKSPPKDLMRGPVCWAKMVIFLKPWTPPDYQDFFDAIPRGVLPGFMVWDAGGGLWWTVTGGK
jgi:hypothetical protein